ncbi:ABC-2 type transporter [uncultured archaeon]|nr:ABC-2 type transporter [uncultured archaeon]
MSMLNTVRLPLIFISGVFIPISTMPIGQEIAPISPLTYGNDILEYVYRKIAFFTAAGYRGAGDLYTGPPDHSKLPLQEV